MANEIRIGLDGTWYYRGVEMSRRDIVRLFYRNLRQDASGGYFIEMGSQPYRVEVEDTAYVVRTFYWSGWGKETEKCVRLLLSDDSVEELDPATLRIGRQNVLYCRVKSGCFDARFSTSSYYRFAENVEYNPLRDLYCISLNGKCWELGTYE
jgi:hypothetical protein